MGWKKLKYNHGEKSLKTPFVIYLDLKCLLLKMLSCHNNLKNSCTERKDKYEPSGWAMFTKCLFDAITKKQRNRLYWNVMQKIKRWCIENN